MKKYILFVLISYFTSSVYGQVRYDLMGVLELDSVNLISYQLQLEVYEDGTIEGYSVSDILGYDETKSKIVGTLNPENQTLLIKETEMIYTKSGFNEDIFCNLEYALKIKDLKSSISTRFWSKYPDGSSCIEGNLNLRNAHKVQKKLDQLMAIMERKTEKGKISQEEFTEIKKVLPPAKIKPIIIGSNEQLNVPWKKSTANLTIWDAANEDGDKISVYLNDEVLISQTIKNEKTIIPISFNTGKNQIRIVALNEGDVARNTVSFELNYKMKNIRINSELKTNESSLINIYCRPE